MLNVLSISKSNTDRINLLLVLADDYIKKAGEIRADLDSAAAFLTYARRINSQLKSQTVLGRILTVEARLNREEGQRDTAIALAEKAIQVLKRGNDRYLLAQAYLENAANYNNFEHAHRPQKTKLIEQAVQCLRQTTRTEQHILLKGVALKQLAEQYALMPGNTQAIKILQEALDDYRAINYLPIQEIYDLMAKIYFGQKDLQNAIKYELMALRRADLVQDSSMQRSGIDNFLGAIYLSLDQKDKAIACFTTALKIAQLHQDKNNIRLLLSNTVSTYIQMQKPGDALKLVRSIPSKFLMPTGGEYDSFVPLAYLQIYTALQRFSDAKVYCNQLIKLLNDNGIGDGAQWNIQLELAKFYLASKNFPAALTYLKLNEVLTNKIQSPHQALKNYRLWHAVDTAMHNFEAANNHILKFFAIHDSLFNETKSKQIQQLQVQYETEKKASELKIKDERILYLNASTRLQQAELTKTKIFRNVTIGAVFFVLIISGLLYRQSQLRKMNNKLITHKNSQLESLLKEKEWLLKEVHHRVKNNLHTIICLLESQAMYLENDALKAIEKSQNRIYTMSLIHQKLYQSENIEKIEMASYIPELIQYLKDSFSIGSEQIYFRTNIDSVSLDPSIAIPVGLIINEAITNSIKYAFPGNRRGEVSVCLYEIGKLMRLELTDNGAGIAKGPENMDPDSLGLQLIRGLAKEIRGDVQINSSSDHGVEIIIIFQKDVFN